MQQNEIGSRAHTLITWTWQMWSTVRSIVWISGHNQSQIQIRISMSEMVMITIPVARVYMDVDVEDPKEGDVAGVVEDSQTETVNAVTTVDVLNISPGIIT